MENPATKKFLVLFNAVIAFILLLTAGLAFMSGGGYVDLFLTSAIVIVLVTIVLKTMFISAENKHE